MEKDRSIKIIRLGQPICKLIEGVLNLGALGTLFLIAGTTTVCSGKTQQVFPIAHVINDIYLLSQLSDEVIHI